MKLLLERIRGLGFGPRPLTESDFFKVCEREKIKTIFTPEPFSWWMRIDGESVIVINDKLRGHRRLFVMFHGLGRHLLENPHERNVVKACGANNSIGEFEAEAFAILAIYRLDDLMSGALHEFERTDRYLKRVRVQREKIHFLYGV